LLVSFSW